MADRNNVSEKDIVYLAAFFDGEGSVMVRQTNSQGLPSALVTVANNDVDLLRSLQKVFGGRIELPPSKHRCHRLVWTKSSEVQFVLECIQPHIRRRKEKVAIALAIAQVTTSFTGTRNVRNAVLRIRLAEKFREVA